MSDEKLLAPQYSRHSEITVDDEDDDLPLVDVYHILNSSRNSNMENNKEARKSNTGIGADETTMGVDSLGEFPTYIS